MAMRLTQSSFHANSLLFTVDTLHCESATVGRTGSGSTKGEAAEQTILQTVVPVERQGRVFGFALTVEIAASPITAFIIGPVAQFWVIPFMNGGAGSDAIGSWFGTGRERGMALVFVIAGLIGLAVSLMALRSPAYKRLSAHYAANSASQG